MVCKRIVMFQWTASHGFGAVWCSEQRGARAARPTVARARELEPGGCRHSATSLRPSILLSCKYIRSKAGPLIVKQR